MPDDMNAFRSQCVLNRCDADSGQLVAYHVVNNRLGTDQSSARYPSHRHENQDLLDNECRFFFGNADGKLCRSCRYPCLASLRVAYRLYISHYDAVERLVWTIILYCENVDYLDILGFHENHHNA